MLSISLGDMLKVLDQFKGWPRMVAAPDRLDALEKRLAALESQVLARPKAEACALCGADMKVISERDDPTFGIMGVRQRTLHCTACPHTTTIQVHPPKR